MNERYESQYHRLEKNHFWFKARRDVISKIIAGLSKRSAILDVGCSIGTTMKFLKGEGYENIYGIDISKKAISICKKDGLKNTFVMDAAEMKFPANKFDTLIASDVIEHIESDDKVIKEFNRVLKPGGNLLVFVPAFKFLWTEGDNASRHFRRYTKTALKGVLERNRFAVDRISYWNFGLFCPFFIMKILRKIGIGTKQYPIHEMNPAVNDFALSLLKAENLALKHGLNFPFGISVFAVARKI